MMRLSPTDRRHGTENGYNNLRCRCDRCRAAHAAYYRTGPGRESLRVYREGLAARGLTTSGRPRATPYRPGRARRLLRPRNPAWVAQMFRTGSWHIDDIEYAAREFPSAVIDAHSYWHSTPGYPPEDLATCRADICVRARAANPLLGLVVAGGPIEIAPGVRATPAYLTTCPNDRERLVDRDSDRVCLTCGYVIVNGAAR